MKKLLSFSLAACLCLSCFIGNMKEAKAYENDIMNYVISGSGTEDDPYVLSDDNEYKEMFDEMAREAVQPTVIPQIDFSGTLTGATYSGQYNGGVWRYSSGGPSTSSNGAMTILGISYANHRVVDFYAAQILSGLTYSAIIKSKINEGLVSTALTNALAPSIGSSNASLVGSFILFAISSANASDNKVLADALASNQGLLEISYRTSYNGSWYYTSCIDVWRTASSGKVTVPGSYYGIGTYSSK